MRKKETSLKADSNAAFKKQLLTIKFQKDKAAYDL
jgi:hypothetical protein